MTEEIKTKLEKIINEYSQGVASEDAWLDLISYTNTFMTYCNSNDIKIDSQDEFELKCIINDIKGYNEVFIDEPEAVDKSWYNTVEQCGTDFSCFVNSVLNKNINS